MKYLIQFAICFSLYSCHSQSSIDGLYTRISNGLTGVLYDTIVVKLENRNSFIISRMTAVRAEGAAPGILDKRTSKSYIGVFNQETQVLQTNDPGKSYQYNSQDHSLNIGDLKYIRK